VAALLETRQPRAQLNHLEARPGAIRSQLQSLIRRPQRLVLRAGCALQRPAAQESLARPSVRSLTHRAGNPGPRKWILGASPCTGEAGAGLKATSVAHWLSRERHDGKDRLQEMSPPLRPCTAMICMRAPSPRDPARREGNAGSQQKARSWSSSLIDRSARCSKRLVASPLSK
jgi:hypothetical protein